MYLWFKKFNFKVYVLNLLISKVGRLIVLYVLLLIIRILSWLCLKYLFELKIQSIYLNLEMQNSVNVIFICSYLNFKIQIIGNLTFVIEEKQLEHYIGW